MTLPEINAQLGESGTADLRKIIADVKAAVTASYDGIIADKQTEIDNARALLASNADEFAAYKAAVTAAREEIKVAIADPNTPTDETVLQIIAEREAEDARPAHDKAVEAAEADVAAAQARLDALTGTVVEATVEEGVLKG